MKMRHVYIQIYHIIFGIKFIVTIKMRCVYYYNCVMQTNRAHTADYGRLYIECHRYKSIRLMKRLY